MNREIKFRAWNKLKGRWEDKLCLYLDDSKIGDVSECFHNEEDSEAYDIQQYTGLKDRNGTEIYEGDILREDWGHGETRDYTVEWGEDGWFLIMLGCEKWTIKEAMKEPCESQPRMVYFYHDMIVVGNIFENPELLENDN